MSLHTEVSEGLAAGWRMATQDLPALYSGDPAIAAQGVSALARDAGQHLEGGVAAVGFAFTAGAIASRWNPFQRATRGMFSSRTEAAAAYHASKAADTATPVAKTLNETLGSADSARKVQRVLKGTVPLSDLTDAERAASAAFYRDVSTRTGGLFAEEAAKYNVARAEFLEGVRDSLPPTLPEFIRTLEVTSGQR